MSVVSAIFHSDSEGKGWEIIVSTICPPDDNPGHIYKYCPSLVATVFFCIMSGFATVIQLAQARRRWNGSVGYSSWLGFGRQVDTQFRGASIASHTNSTLYSVQLLFVPLAPLWVNTLIYVVLGRMICYFPRTTGFQQVWKCKDRVDLCPLRHYRLCHPANHRPHRLGKPLAQSTTQIRVDKIPLG